MGRQLSCVSPQAHQLPLGVQLASVRIDGGMHLSRWELEGYVMGMRAKICTALPKSPAVQR